MIPVQVTARSRRKYTLRGNRVAQSGAPRKESGLTRQLDVSEDDDSLHYRLRWSMQWGLKSTKSGQK